MLTDTHCHLYYDELKKDITNVLNRAETLGVNRFICVGTNMEDSLQCLELAEKYENIFASAGIHHMILRMYIQIIWIKSRNL